eukprot:1142980-Pelagomonas_calceolata.AAC.3
MTHLVEGMGSVDSPTHTQEDCVECDFGTWRLDEINLIDAEGNVVASAKWTDATLGHSLRHMPEPKLTSNGAEAYPGEPKYQKVPENKPVLEILQDLGIYKTFLEALRSAGLAEKLGGENDPDYPGPPPKPVGPEQEIIPEFPWWFGFSIDRSQLPPPPPPPALPPPPPPGIPELGPYTVLAPTDEAFDILLLQLGGGRPLPKSTLLALPELKDILQYHVLPGMYATASSSMRLTDLMGHSHIILPAASVAMLSRASA